jgi:protease IV
MADDKMKRRPHPVVVALAVVGVLALTTVFAIIAVLGFAISKAPDLIPSSMSSMGSGKTEFLKQLGHNEKSVAGIRVEGEIQSLMANEILEKLKEAGDDPRIVGILLEVESPGGAVVPSQEMYDAIMKTKAKKPVVAYVRDVAASGAYYTIASASSIVANRGSMVGSIGVIMQSFQANRLFDTLKLDPVTLKTGALKDAGSPVRPWTDADKEYLQKLISDTREQFATDVKTARNLPEATMSRMADGRVVLGTEALNLRLVDRVGDRDAALDELSKLTKVTPLPEVFYMEEQPVHVPFVFRYLLDEGAKSFVKASAEGVKTGVQESLQALPERR